jgi:Lon protease-like protein
MHYCYETRTLPPRRLIRLVGLFCFRSWRWQAQEDPYAVRAQRKEPWKRNCHLQPG